MGLFKRIKQRKQSQKANTNHNVPFMLERLEPRLLLSADMNVAAGVLSSTIGQFSTEFESFYNAELSTGKLDTPLPLINQVIGIYQEDPDDVFNDAQKVAPSLDSLLAMDVDLDGAWGAPGIDAELNTWDTNNDDKVDFIEFLQGHFISEIQTWLSGPTSSDPADFYTFLNGLDRDFNSTLSGMDYIGDIDFDVIATNQSDANQVAFDVQFRFSTTKELPLDLGRGADELGLSFPNAFQIKTEFNFDMQFGILTSGETPTTDDAFLEIDNILVRANTGVINMAGQTFDLGFLGLETFAPSTLQLDAQLSADFVDPTSPTSLGFTESQFGTTATGGVFTADIVPPSFNLTDSAEFTLRIGDANTVTVTVAAGNYGSLGALVTAVQASVNSAGLTGMVTVDSTGGKLRLTVVTQNFNDVGFSSELTLDGVAQTAGVAPTFSTPIQFLLSVDHGTPELISVAGHATVDGLVTQLDGALSGKGITVTKDGVKVKFDPGSQHIQISNDLTFDSKISFSDLTGTSVNLSVDHAEALVDLKVKISSGINGLSQTDLEISFGGDPGDAFNQSLDLLAPDVKDQLRIFLNPTSDITFTNFGNLLNFNEITPTSLLALVRQLGTWLDNARQSELFSSIELPFANGDLGDVLDFADLIEDALLFDDGDDGIGGAADTEKLMEVVGGALLPRFTNAQGLASMLDSTLGVLVGGAAGANYDIGTDILTYDINISHDLLDIELPIDFNLNLTPLLDVSSNSTVVLDATAGLQITLGLDLSAGVGGLTPATTLDTIDANLVNEILGGPALTATNASNTIYGRLNSDAVFDIDIGGGTVYRVTVYAVDPDDAGLLTGTDDNITVADLVADIDNALENAEEISPAPGSPRDLTTLHNFSVVVDSANSKRIKLSSSSTDFTLTAASGNSAVTELGFLTTHEADGSPWALSTVKDAPKLVGRLTADAEYTITIGGTTYTVTVEAGETDANRTIIDLINDLNNAIETPSLISDAVTVSDLTGDAHFSISVNGGTSTPVTVLASSTDGTATVSFDGAAAPNTGDDTITLGAHTYLTGDEVVYTNGGGTDIGGLTDGTTYYVIVVDGTTIKLADTLNNANANSAIDLTAAGVGAVHLLTDAPNVTVASFDGASAPNTGDDTITLGAHTFLTGDEVVYTNGGGTDIVGLTDGTTYYVIVVDGTTIKLADTFADANADLAIDLTAVGSGADHRLTDTVNSTFEHLIDDINRAIGATALAGLITAEHYEHQGTDRIRLTADDESVVKFDLTVVATNPADTDLGLPTTTPLMANLTNLVEVLSQGDRLVLNAYSDEHTFDGAADVDIAGDTITITNHGLVTGRAVDYSHGGGTEITGLAVSTTYYAIVVDANTIKLATSEANALAGNNIDFTGAGVGTAHTLTVNPIAGFTVNGSGAGFDDLGFTNGQTANSNDFVIKLTGHTFDGAAAPNPGDETITIGAHTLLTGDVVVYTNGGGTDIGGLSDGTTYYVIVVDGTRVKLADTFADANANLAIDLTAVGAGAAHTLGTQHIINLDGATTIGDVISKIVAQTGGNISGLNFTLAETDPGYNDYYGMTFGNVGVIINDDDSGLKLEDNTWTGVDGTPVFHVQPTNASPVAIRLGILKFDPSVDSDLDGDIDGADGDGIIDGGALVGAGLAGRFFIENLELTFNGSTDVSVSADTITLNDHNLLTGRALEYSDGGGTSITGLTDGTTYYAIVVNANTVKLADTRANALADTAIVLTAVGVGADHSLTVKDSLFASFDLTTPARNYANLTMDAVAHEIVTAATPFEPEDVGQYLDITDDVDFFGGRYRIVTVDPVTGTATLDSDSSPHKGVGLGNGTGQIKGVQASASLGFVGIDLVGDGSLNGSISTGFIEPGYTLQDGKILLSELFEDLGSLTDFLQVPEFDGSGSMTLDIILRPDLSLISLGANPQVVMTVNSIGNPFAETSFPSPLWVDANTFTVSGDHTSTFTTGTVIEVELDSSTVSAEVLTSAVDSSITTVDLVSNVLSGGSIASVTAPTPPAIVVTFPNLPDVADLLKFEDISFSNILDALSNLVDFLSGIEGLDFFDQEIPLINKSVNDLLSFADKFTTALDEIESDPAGTIQLLEAKLRNAFGLPEGPGPDFNLVLDGGLLKFELDLGISFNESLGVEIPEFLNLGDLGISGLTGGLIDLGGSADLNASGSLTAVLDFGIDLGITNPLNLGDIYIYDTTGVEAEISASGENLSFWASLGPFGLFIQNHPDFDSEVSIGGTFSANVEDTANTGNKAKIGDVLFDLGNFDTEITGTISGTLPTFFPRESDYVGNITVAGDLADIANFVFITDGSPAPSNAIVLDASDVIDGIKNFDFANQFNLFDNILLAVDGVDMFLEGIQYLLDTKIFSGLSLPVIGNPFTEGADFIEDFREDFIGPFRDLIETVENAAKDFAQADKNIISKFLYDILGPSGIDLLLPTDNVHPQNDGYYTDQLIGLATNLDQYLDPEDDTVDLEETYIQWNLTIGGEYEFGTDFGFDVGVPGLGLEADGDVSVKIAWDLDLGFGISFQDGFYLDISDENELTAYLIVNMDDTTLVGTLGFLQLTAAVNEVDLGLAFAVNIKEKGATGDDADKLTFTELGKIEIEFGIAAEAIIDLALELGISADVLGSGAASGFPKVGADFILDWGIAGPGPKGFNSSNPEDSNFFTDFTNIGTALQDSLKYVGFQNITLDLGSFVSDVLGPIVGKVQDITEPIQPLIDFITTPFPVLSDFGLNITPLDLAAAYGQIDPGLIYAIADIITLVNSIPDPDDVGSLKITIMENLPIYDNGDSEYSTGSVFDSLRADLWNSDFDLSNAFNDIKGELIVAFGDIFGDNWFSDALGTLAGEAADIMGDLTSEAGATNPWAFPILEDPMQVLGLLMGRPAVLVTYDMEPLVFEFEYSQFFPIWGPLGVSINVEFGATIDFAFGYDTLGIQEFVESDFRNPLLLFDGFYVSDTDLATGDFGTDVPELVLSGGLWAAAEINLVVARAGVGGGVFIEIEFDLFDPDRDGRVRIKELIGNVMNEWNYGIPVLAPLAIFDVHGEITAKLFAFLKIDLFLFEIDKRWDITPEITILEFDIPFTRPPILATELPGGDLQINAGPYADQRLNGNISDISEHFIVRQSGSGKVEVKAPGLWDHWQEYSINSSDGTIIFKGGEGDDIFEVEGVMDATTSFEIDAGVGNDEIRLSSSSGALGAAIIYGSEGDDTIYGGSGDDIIYGLKGNDTIYGGGGNDIIFGDNGRISKDSITAFFNPSEDGNDTIYGGDGNDIIFGSGGNDTIYGDANNDIIIGDGGKLVFETEGEDKTVANVDEVKGTQRDRLNPQGGNDILIGGADTDIIYGGTGNDTIDGGAGNDELYGEDGFDTIYGGSGADEIYGGTGGDTIYGERDPDLTPTPDPDPWDETDSGTDGDDIIYGQDGRDTIHGDGGADEIYGGSGADTIYGDADNDEIYGEGDPDIIYGGWGDDTIDGGAGSDVIYGDNGPDDFVAPTTGGPWNATVYGVNVPGEYLFGTTKSKNPLAEDANDTIYSGMGSDFLDGQTGHDTYIILLEGANNRAFTNVYDSGEDNAETDYMKLFGTMYDDEFLLRASSSTTGLAFVALINEDPNVERVNYWRLERMRISGGFGDDYFAVDDTHAEVTIEGNEGEDRFQVGQLYRSPRDGGAYEFNNIETEDIYFTIETTVGWLSNGISKPMTIYGGTENDYFTVFHNKEVLSLFGEDGDDTFLIKAFALAGSQEPQRERTDVSGGAGADLVQYAMNAPVNIDGGDGFDTVIIIGTEFGDDFVITKNGVYGAGLNVNFVNIESLSVDGAEGDDRFYVMSTSEKFATQIFGGLGSDTFNMSGDTPPIISNDLRGHSGIITHDIENTGTIYDETIIAGISANVADNDKQDPTVVISEPDGSTVITEGGVFNLTDWNLWDYYNIVLSKSPGSGNEVIVQVMAPVQTQDQEERESKLLMLYSPSETAFTPDRTTISLTFNDTNWYTPQIVRVGAPDDANPDLDYDDNAMEGPATGFINHVVTSDIGIPGPLHPEIVDSLIVDYDEVTHFVDLQVDFELEGVSSGYMVYINDGPGAGQSLRVKEVQGHELLLYRHFRSDYMPDGTSTYTIRQDISAVRAVTALVYDNDKAGVVISETDASTELFENGATDTINVVLTRQPTDDVEVTLLSNDGQLEFSTTDPDAYTDVDGNLVLKFTASNYNTSQTVTVTALNDSVREGFHHGLISFTVASSDSDTDVNVTGESTTLTMTQAYMGLKNRPKNGQVTEVRVGSVARDPSLYEVISNKVVFLKEAGTNEYEFLPAGTVVDVDYTYVNLGYDNLEVKPVLTNIADNDVAQVKITETVSSTDVIEDARYTGTATSGGTDSLTDTGASFPDLSDYLVQITGGTGTGQVRTIASNTGDTITVTSKWDIAPDYTSEYAVILPDHDGVPFTDTYKVVLTKAPDADVEILITPEITKTSAGPTIHWNKQVAVTSSHPYAVDNGDGTLTLTFTTGNWDTPQTVKVIAVDDDYYDGDDTQVFAPQLHTVSDIQGPLYLYGAGGQGSIIAFEPLMLPYELNDMKETGPVLAVGEDGTTITVGADTLLAGAAAINSNVTDVEDLVTEKMTVTIADGVDEIGQFRLIVGAVLDDKGTAGDTTDDEVTLTLNAPWELSESEKFDDITEYTITRMSPNFFAVEAEQIDYVFVYNEDSPADNIIESRQGLLTDSTMDGFTGNAIVEEFVTQMDGKWLSGFGMGTEDLKIGPYYHPHGITYGDMEVVEINLGDGIDHFTVEDTHIRADGFQTWTIINTGDEYIGTDGDLVTVSLNSDVKELHSGTVTSASEYTLYDSGAAFPVTLTEKGLAGYIVEITGGTGLGQRRVIASNTATDLTLLESWNINPDDMSNYRIMGAELATGDTTTYLADETDTLADTSGSFDSSLLGKVLEIIDGSGAGFKKEIIEVVDDHTLRLSSDWAFEEAPTEQSHYRIYGDQDGPVSINTQAGEDTVVGSASSIPLVIFGGEGEDTIFGGSADDIIFGDNGLVAYVNEEYVSEEYEGEDGKIVTLLGLARSKIDPEYVTAATESTLTDDDPASFPVQSIDQPGLEGLMVSITDGAGFREEPHLIVYNTSTILTVYPEWETALNPDPGGIFDPTNPDSNPSKYRISFVPEDQTDAVVRDPSLLIAIDETVGGDDTITGNGGNDRIFGGLGDDEINGNTGDDIIFGDHGRLDYTPDDTVGGEDGPAQGDFVPATLDRVRTTFDDIGGADTIYGDDGEDIILGGYNTSDGENPEDKLYGNTGNDIILGDNGLLDFSPNASTTDDPRDVVLYSIETIAPDDGGDDIIYGNEANDIIFGGDEDDTIDAGEGNNIIFGDNGLINYVIADDDPSDIDLIESTATTYAGGVDDITSGNGQDIIIGGRFGDTIDAGNGDNLVIGDSGRITAADADDPQFAGMPMTFGLIETIEPDDGGKDNVTTGSGFDIVLGGDEGDTVDVGEGNNIVLGDNGRIDYVRKERDGDVPGADLNPDDIDLIETTPTTYAGGADDITSGAGQDVILGGRFGDTVDAGDGDNLVIGDSGRITAADADDPQFADIPMTFGLIETIEPDNGGEDNVTTGSGFDIVLGGDEGDTVDVGEGNNVVLGDNGLIDYVRAEREPTADGADLIPGDIDLIVSTATTYAGGSDNITSGDGQDIIIGGRFGDTINANDGDNIVIGDSGQITAADANAPQFAGQPMTFGLIETIEPDDGGDDTITTLSGYDIVFGGDENDIIDVGEGNNIIFGDNGLIDYVRAEREPLADGADLNPGDIDLILSTATTYAGGNDTITSGAGQDIIIGGRLDDTVNAGDGDNLVIGDSGRIRAAEADTVEQFTGHPMTVGLITTIQPDDGGQDQITTGDDNDIILGGFESDTIVAGGDDDWVLGDNGLFLYDLPGDDTVSLERPDVVAHLQAKYGSTILPLDDDTPLLPDPRTLDLVMTTDPMLGDDDVIYGNAGNDTILGGTGRDRIWGDSDNDNLVDNAVDGDGADLIFGDHAIVYPSIHRAVIDEDFLGAPFANPYHDPFFINNYFFSIDTSENDGFNTDGVMEFAPGTDFEDTIFGSGGDDTIIGGQDDDILFGGADDDILIGGHNVLGGHDEMDDMDTASIKAILPDELADLDPSDVNDINDVMDGGSQNDVMAGDNAIIIRQNAFTTFFLLNSESPRYQLLNGTLIYSMNTQMLDGLFAVDVGFSSNIAGVPQAQPGSVVGYSVILLNHSEAIQNSAAQLPTAPRVFGNDVMAGGSENDEMFGQLGDDIMQGDGSVDMVSTTGWQMPDGTTPFDPSPAVDPSFIIPDNQSTPPYTYFMVEGNYLLFHSDEAANDGDDYMEGNAGNDRMYGNLGQDDMIGGNSTLFGLDDATAAFYEIPDGDFARPDGADMIYGGAGVPTRLARNDFVGSGDTAPTNDDVQIPEVNRHARDADMILGDNANIYRLVDGDGNYLEFAYDQDSTYEGRGGLRIIPRAVELLDYWYTYEPGLEPDSLSFVSLTGTGDLIYGESGDDIIHGMTGDDVLFGNSEDDDLYGEAGQDWISGGTGEDGILGDDGLILTSRNDLVAEPLYEIAALNPEQVIVKKNDPVDTNALNAEISTPGNIQRAIINVEGTLKKTVDLLVFDAGLANNETLGVNDIIFGGLNDDWIHAGAGDDAVSGAEALPVFYTAGEVDVDGQGTLVEINELLQIQQDAPINDDPDLAENPFWFDFAPYNPGDILRYEGNTASEPDDPHGKTKQEFALYDEFFPRRKIMLDENGEAVEHAADAVFDFLLNFNEDEGPLGYAYLGDDAAMQTDGDDRIFGDLGNDWIVGGTGRDNMYGGRGDDLLNMDDNHDSGPGGKVGPHDPEPDVLDNTQSDEYQAYADIAYGGAGRDVLILNTGADRAIDWVGEYNSYIVPFSPFGAFHISRTLQPQLPEFLYDLSESDGIDTTVPDGARYVEQKNLDVRVDEPDLLRNGEPYGELGMVRQTDFDWHDQTGAPNDPQPGNLQGQREIMRRELFTDEVAPKLAFGVDVGIWTLADGGYKAAPEMLFGEAVSIYHLDLMQPSYMEILATVKISKALELEGLKKKDAEELGSANAYIIFDYLSATDFKFAGLSQKTNKVQIGHRTPDGWVRDVELPMQLRANRNYDLTLVMYGTVATIWVNEQVSLSHDFGEPLNDGLIGLGTDNSVARFDDFQVQKLPPTITFQFPVDFQGTSPNPFVQNQGVWVTADGRYVGSASEGQPALATWDLSVAMWSLLEFEALIDTESMGGLVFDYYGPEDFKFAAIDTLNDQVVIGHYTSKGWFIDASAERAIEPGICYELGISMLGTSVSVTLDGEAVVGHVFNSLLNDGDLGLLSKDGVSSFDYVVAQGDDPAYAEESGEALKATSLGDATDITELNQAELAPIIDAAIDYWVDIVGVDASKLADVSFLITDLSEMFLAVTVSNTILIDTDAAGYGWFVDKTPYDNIEFGADGGNGELAAALGSEVEGSMDLLTVITHELGHVLGLEDVDTEEHDLMSDTLATDVRRVYAEAAITTLPLDGWIVRHYSFNNLLNDDDWDLSAIHHGRK